MALLSVAVWNTKVNNRVWLLEETLKSFRDTVDFTKHRLFVIDNGSETATGTFETYEKFKEQFPFTLIALNENVGTARAINQAWQYRYPGEHCLKADSDIRITESGWLDKLIQCIDRDPNIGIIGLKRSDLIENPWRDDWYKSTLHMLPQKPGEDWLIVEKVNHCIGTAQLYNSKLLDKIGYLYQLGGKYGFDDSLAAARCKVAGMYSCFYPHYKLEHLDPGDTDYQKWKEAYAGTRFGVYHQFVADYESGKKPIYHGIADD